VRRGERLGVELRGYRVWRLIGDRAAHWGGEGECKTWLGLRYNPWMREVYERVRRGSKTRKKIAIVAVARRLLIRCWAMLRDGPNWSPPALGESATRGA